MSETEKLSLPGSSHDQISKILHAYALCGEKAATLDEVASKAAINGTIVSRNNGFLVSLNLLTPGKAKSLTQRGRELAIALGHDLEEDMAIAWRRAILEAPAAKPVLDMLRVQKSVAVDSLPARIAATLGLPDSAATKTGTNTLIDILRIAGLTKENDGKISLVDSKEPTIAPVAQSAATEPRTDEATLTNPIASNPVVAVTGGKKEQPDSPPPIPIHVNIELHLPASAEQTVYDALFKSIRENLLNR